MNNRLRGILYGIASILVLMFFCSLIIAMFVKFTDLSSTTLTWTILYREYSRFDDWWIYRW